MESKTSKAQLEVWEWKEKAYQKMKNIPKKAWLRHIIFETGILAEEINKHKREQLKENKKK